MAHDEESGQVGRRSLLKTAAALGVGTLAGRGIYEALGDVVRPTPAEAATTVVRRLQEQYLVQQIEVILDNGQAVAIPPIFNDVFTAKVKPAVLSSAAALKNARTRLENALVAVESPYPDTAAGLTMVIAWGLPYFRSSVLASLSGQYLPKLPPTAGGGPAILDAIKFDSDPDGVVLESNDVVFKFRSDKQSIVQAAENALFFNAGSTTYVGDLFDLTSKRIGFLGRGFGTLAEGKTRLAAQNQALADLIPARSQLMMGFTSTQTGALGPDNIPSFETLKGMTDQWPAGYFAAGCAMHLSHLSLDLDSWYNHLSYTQRVQQMFSPGTPVPTDTTVVTIPNGPAQVTPMTQVTADAANGLSGHNSLLQQATRLASDQLDNYGRLRRKGTGIPLREDFNTLDNPFAWTSDTQHPVGPQNAPGLHFVAFVPSHVAFHKARHAMDGFINNQQLAKIDPKTAGINSVVHATHRQNFVVPPRAHRSFPLVDLLK